MLASGQAPNASVWRQMSSICSPKSCDSIDLHMAIKFEKIFLRVSPGLKEKWVSVVDETRAPQNQVGEALVEWFISLDRYQRADVLAGKFVPSKILPSQSALPRAVGIAVGAEREASPTPRVVPDQIKKRQRKRSSRHG